MKLLDFPLVKLTIYLIVGIFIGAKIKFSVTQIILITTLLFALTSISYFISKNKFKKSIWFGACAILSTISVGILTITMNNETNFRDHYLKKYDFNNPRDSHIILKINEQLKPSIFHNRYIGTVSQIDSVIVEGKVQLNISKDSISNLLPVDCQIVATAKLKELKVPLNPYQFNYKSYLENKNIYAQVNCNYEDLTVLKNHKLTVFGFANNIRQSIITNLEAYNFKPDELAVIKALLLGYRQDISNDLYEDYIDAGAIHILAISGLHIGIILIMLNFLLGFLGRFKYGLPLKTVLLLILLWSFALVAGLSPSILRATTMFSVFAIGMNLKRPHNVMNTLAISAFALLLYNPFLLFEVGFQLSYLAVIGIVTVFPMIKTILTSKYKLLDYLLDLLAVSFAAQVGLLPLSLLYFHQFPGLFFISNVLIIPILGIILGYGFIIIMMAIFHMPQNIIVDIYGYIIHYMNALFKWVAQQESFLFKDIPLNWFLAFGMYLIILCVIRYFRLKNYRRLIGILFSILLFQLLLTYNKYQTGLSQEIVIFHKSRFNLIGVKDGRYLSVFHNLDSTFLKRTKIIKNYEVGSFIRKTTYDTLRNAYQFHNKELLIIDSLGIYQNLKFKPEYILLTNSPKINLNRLIDSLQPEYIISDGSNYTSYINRWNQTCRKRKLPFHYTGEKGAFIIK